MAHVRVLSSDNFEGREPGTTGETKTINYIADKFADAGLTPIGGGFLQNVPIRALSAAGKLSVRMQSGTVPLDAGRDFILQASSDLSLSDEELVFAGYGKIAPEFGRDDYASTDVTGKVVIVLAGEPDGFPSSQRSSLGSRADDHKPVSALGGNSHES